jgi:hypothetical protein
LDEDRFQIRARCLSIAFVPSMDQSVWGSASAALSRVAAQFIRAGGTGIKVWQRFFFACLIMYVSLRS